ncbi:MAG: hypothetical protein OXE79_10945 [Acidimicrobiaceae bacterium]|nr:hypothetical protein [Acidimicrobiaceae bacterium]MCY4175423.1 hypothetical protein [Acidimicrobiaceae bacterium]MCY4279169.1 hypothetical protein [Acidimicrobiaceae bacterium]MCY4293483.1 hypothetical protein [Acidimicrobiaceae bacterium]
MTSLLQGAELAVFGLAMFQLGLIASMARRRRRRRRVRRRRSGSGRPGSVTRKDIREEMCRDPVAVDMFMSDDTPRDVQRYLYMEAGRRAMMRKRSQLSDEENDFFAPPLRPCPDPGFTGCAD